MCKLLFSFNDRWLDCRVHLWTSLHLSFFLFFWVYFMINPHFMNEKRSFTFTTSTIWWNCMKWLCSESMLPNTDHYLVWMYYFSNLLQETGVLDIEASIALNYGWCCWWLALKANSVAPKRWCYCSRNSVGPGCEYLSWPKVSEHSVVRFLFSVSLCPEVLLKCFITICFGSPQILGIWIFWSYYSHSNQIFLLWIVSFEESDFLVNLLMYALRFFPFFILFFLILIITLFWDYYLLFRFFGPVTHSSWDWIFKLD